MHQHTHYIHQQIITTTYLPGSYLPFAPRPQRTMLIILQYIQMCSAFQIFVSKHLIKGTQKRCNMQTHVNKHYYKGTYVRTYESILSCTPASHINRKVAHARLQESRRSVHLVYFDFLAYFEFTCGPFPGAWKQL